VRKVGGGDHFSLMLSVVNADKTITTRERDLILKQLERDYPGLSFYLSQDAGIAVSERTE